MQPGRCGLSVRSVLVPLLISMVAGIVILAPPVYSLLDGSYRLPRALVITAMLGGTFGALLVASLDRLRGIYMAILLMFLIEYYQLALLDSAPPGASWVRMLPFFLLIPVMISPALAFLRKSSSTFWMFLCWVILHLPSVTSGVDTKGGEGYFLIAVLLPPLVYASLCYVLQSGNNQGVFLRLVLLGCCINILASLVSIPFEMWHKGATAILSAGNLGNANVLIGDLLLLWPLTYIALEGVSNRWRIVFFALLFSFAVVSFSRGGILCLSVLLLVSNIGFGQKTLQRFILRLSMVGVLAATVALLFPYLLWQWGLKFNLVSNYEGEQIAYSLATVFKTDRGEILKIAWGAAWNSDLLGIGLGQMSRIMQDATGGEWAFDGSHNLILTVFTERGVAVALFFLFGFGAVISRYASEIFSGDARIRYLGRIRLSSILIFLLYAHTTGAELTHLSDRMANAQTSVFLALLLAGTVSTRARFMADGSQ